MDTCGNQTSCKNATYGCTFTGSSEVDIMKHLQWDCAFHPVRCFKCNRTVRKVNSEEHYTQFCKNSSTLPCSAPEDVSDVGLAEAIRMMSQEQRFLRECVRECTLGLESLSHVMKDVAADVAEVKVMKTKQEDLEAIVKGQGDVTQEHGKSIALFLEKIDTMQEDISALVKKCMESVDMLSLVMKDVAGNVAGLKFRTGAENDLEAIVRRQGDSIKGPEKAMLTNAEKVSKVKKEIKSIVERFEKVDGSVKEVRVLTHPVADEGRIHWYVENISQYIEESKTRRSTVKSDVFAVRGYSATLMFQLDKRETGLSVGIYLHLRRGPNDSLLRWPFAIPYTLSLIHPNDASKRKEHKVTPPGNHPRCFEKPKEKENCGVGTAYLCTVDQLQSEGFIENDSVCFSLTL